MVLNKFCTFSVRHAMPSPKICFARAAALESRFDCRLT